MLSKRRIKGEKGRQLSMEKYHGSVKKQICHRMVAEGEPRSCQLKPWQKQQK